MAKVLGLMSLVLRAVSGQTIRSRLTWLVIAFVLPICLAGNIAVYEWYQDKKSTIQADAVHNAHSIMLIIDRDLAAILGALGVLATSPHLEAGNLAGFHAQAREILRDYEGSDILLADSTGQQLVNSFKPFGESLPRRGNLVTVHRIFETGQPVISNLYRGAVTGRAMIGLDTPARHNGQVVYDLGMSVPVDRFTAILTQQRLPADWIAAVIDTKAVTLARIPHPEQFIGMVAKPALVEALGKIAEGTAQVTSFEGTPMTMAFSRSPLSGWTAVVGVPTASLEADLRVWLWWMEGGVFTLSMVCLGLAIAMGRGIARPIRALTAPALALGQGEPVSLPTFGLWEADEVGRSLAKAARLLQQRADERDQAEQALQAAKNAAERAAEEIEDLYNHAPCGYHSLDADENFVRINETELSWLGYRRQEVVGKLKFSELLTPTSRTLFRSHFPVLKARGWTRDQEFEMVRRDGTILPVMLSATVISDRHGGYLMSRSAVYDITERKRSEAEITRYRDHLEALVAERTAALTETNRQLAAAKEKAEAANYAKSTFLANMSHEIRTPMNAILGFTQIMQRSSNLEPRDRDNLEIIHRSGRNLLALINDVLEMSKIEAGRTDFAPSTFDLPDLLDDLGMMFKVPAEAKALHWEVALAAELPRYVVTDHGKLRQILINLIGNAIKFTEVGGVTLRARATAGGPGGGGRRLEIEVEDSGPGIAADEQGHLFEAFRQAASGLEKGGTGLGLALSRRFARLMGGEITILSNPGLGSVFRLELPVEEGSATELPATGPRQRVIGLRPGQDEFRLLIVDDKADNRLFLRRLLEPLGFALREAVNGQQAISQWQDWRPQLILMDMVMPVMDGHEAIRRIRARPDGATVRIVALSASAFDEDRAAVLTTGADDFLRKPVVDDVLLHTLADHLGAQYDYAEDAGRWPQAVPQPRVELQADALKAVAPALLDRMRRAAYRTDDVEMAALIDELPPELTEQAATLRFLAARFDWETLDRLLDLKDDC